jgi:hypothetical protein
MDRKPQQQTLSIRISDDLREFLERSKQVISAGRGELVSLSDVAKALLESAREDRLDFRIEVADLQHSPTEAMCNIRQKWETRQSLSRAEWTLLGLYIQIACEKLSENPGMPTPQAYVTVLEALLAVRDLRTERGSGLDRYYLGNLGVQERTPLNDRQLDSEVVPRVVAKLIEDLKTTENPTKPNFAGRNLYVALRDEVVPDVMVLNRALDPFLPTLFRLGARGHWLQEGRPVRLRREGQPVSWAVPPPGSMPHPGIELHASLTTEGDLFLSMLMLDRGVRYPLGSYPHIREFAAMVDGLEPGKIWNGVHFYGAAEVAFADRPASYVFWRHSDRIQFTFTEAEWRRLRDVMFYGLADPRLQSTLGELSLVYGEL